MWVYLVLRCVEFGGVSSLKVNGVLDFRYHGSVSNAGVGCI